MIYILENIFYSFFKFFHKSQKKEDARDKTIFFMIIFLSMNVKFVYSLICYLFFKSFYFLYFDYVVLLFTALSFIFLIKHFVIKKRYLMIVEKFSNETENQRSNRLIIFGIYLFVSVFLFLLSFQFAEDIRKVFPPQ